MPGCGGDSSKVSAVRFDLWRVIGSADGRFVVSTGELRYILWEIIEGRLVARCKIHFGEHAGIRVRQSAVDFSPEGDLVAIGNLSSVYVIDLQSLKITGTIDGEDKPPLIEEFEKQPE